VLKNGTETFYGRKEKGGGGQTNFNERGGGRKKFRKSICLEEKGGGRILGGKIVIFHGALKRKGGTWAQTRAARGEEHIIFSDFVGGTVSQKGRARVLDPSGRRGEGRGSLLSSEGGEKEGFQGRSLRPYGDSSG